MSEHPLPLHWSTRALERVSEAMDYQARYSPEAAERWVDGLFRNIEDVAAFPRRGRVVPELGRDEIREVFHEQHRVIYKITPKRLEILTVRHMRQHLDEGDIDD